MTLTPRLSLEDTIALLRSQIGVSWPNPWWPTGIPTFNDCAAFQSWGLWGLNGNQPYQAVVSGIIERSGLEFHAGHAGIQRGDMLGLRWSTAVNYDHIGMALGPPNANGVIQTIDANGGTNKVAISYRSLSQVHNFARPHYPTLVPASGNETPITYHQEDPMAHPAGIVYKIINPSGGGLHGVKIVAGATLTVLPSDSVADFVAGLLNHGLEAFPDYRAPKTGTPDIAPKDDPGQGEGTPLPITQANSDWLAALYGPQIPGGTIAHLWGLASKSGQPATYQPAP